MAWDSRQALMGHVEVKKKTVCVCVRVRSASVLSKGLNFLSTLFLDGSYEGNPNLCASESCGKQKKEKGLIIVVVSLASAVLLISLLSLALWKFFNHRRGVYDSSTTEQPENYEETQNVASSDPIASLPEQDKGGFIVPIHDERSNDSLCPDGWQFTYARIEKMTNNLDTPIGKGGFGTVYLGYKDDGIKVTKVAVKILSQKSDQGTTEFQNEIEVLMKVQHKNLVPFIGYCDDGVNRALVYEYMSCGNLKKYLGNDTGSADWRQRLQIAIDVAKGLEHLHSKCEPRIVHRDIKSENILLDEKLVAKVADFGLCKFLPEDVTHIMTRVMGSFGYLDPEYYNTHALNEKSDVYSYGLCSMS
ncbi:putative LRR receptor-like serine/threonine-protein kinase [Acorus calamus]|uniref:LRR receptor-like serine/threonine-protein kinase n=1 Tax=Acorus calamus TaxID=4465 RepID=A0AAV9CLC5_ACOCL|nr:putative LRR receptor-like serine/threonine-protein kinase [Acorus calamus]